MNAPLSVWLSAPHWHWARALVATLPRSLRLSDSGAGEVDLAIIDGTREWSSDVAKSLSDGCRNVLVINPGDAEPDAIMELADAVESSGAQVIVSEGFAASPAIANFRLWLGQDFSTLAVQGTGAATVQSILLAQLRILRALGVTGSEARSVQLTPRAFIAELRARRAEAPIMLRLAGSVCEPVSHRQVVMAFAPQTTARLDLYDGNEARPALARLVTHEGLRMLPAIYENAHRHVLRMLVATHGEPRSEQSSGQLRALADDSALARSMCSSS